MATVDLDIHTKTSLLSPFGTIVIEGSESGVRSVYVSEDKTLEMKILPIEHPVEQCRLQLMEYFAKKRKIFEVKFDWSGKPDFHKAVWEELLKIPYGQTVSYLDIAERLGDSKAVRAVGQANGKNPIGIVVPCHRVIGKSGHLTGYAGGLDMKMKLLQHENPQRFPVQGTLPFS